MQEARRYPLVVCTPACPGADGTPPSSPRPPARAPQPPERLAQFATETAQLRQQAHFWKRMFEGCRQRQSCLAQEHRAQLQRLAEQTQARERLLQERIAALEAQVRVLEQRLRGRKSEKKKTHPETGPLELPPRQRARGQQLTNPAPARRRFDHLPQTEEWCALPPEAACCPHCHAPFVAFAGRDEGTTVEIEVRAYRRHYRRRRYRKTCTCPTTPTLVTAPPPPKLIPKSYLGISVWVLLLLEKYAAYQPTYRFLSLLRSFGVDLSLGTITGGLQKLVPLFEPLYRALAEHQRQEHHWHCDETRWLVFSERQGQTQHHWSLWVFQSPEAVVFLLDPTRTHQVAEDHLDGATGIASVDRASIYKAMAQVKAGDIILAFCWAHVRRDFLEIATGYAALHDWVVSWLEDIRGLYQRHDAWQQARAQAAAGIASSQPSTSVTAAELQLRAHVAYLAQRRDAELQQPKLAPVCTKVLTSMHRHWPGLTVFLDHPEVPLDNNAAERAERGPVVARKNYYGSGAAWSGRLAAMLFSLLHTLKLWHLCPLRWLTAYLTACAQAGGKAPQEATAFLPWKLSAEQKQQWALPSSRAAGPTARNTS